MPAPDLHAYYGTLVCAAALIGATAPVHAHAKKELNSIVEQYRLENGLTVILAPNDRASVVAAQAWVGVGSVDESASRLGIAHVFEHMLFKGTERRGIGQIAHEIESAGGEINAWTSFHNTVFHTVLAKDDLEIGLDILADALQNSTFDADELAREREVVVEEILQSRDNPMRNVAQLLLATAISEHPYRRPVIGDEASVRSLRRSHMLDFYRRWYVANNITLVVTGGFQPAQTKRLIARFFGAMRSRPVRRRRHGEPVQSEPRAAVATQKVRESYLALGFPMPALDSPDLPALDVAAIALGQGESSRLFRSLRRDRELVTGIHAHAQPLRERGLFIVSATSRPDRLSETVEATVEQMMQLAHGPVLADEVAKAKRALEADIIYQRETVQGMARMYGYYHANVGDVDFESAYLSRILALQPAAVQEVARAYLRPERLSIAAVVPPGSLGRRGPKTASRHLLAQARKGVRRATRARKAQRPRSPSGARVADTSKSARQDRVSAVLPSGVRVIIQRDDSVPVVAMRAVWPGGLRWETPTTNGISQLLARMLVRGCGDLGARDIVDRLDELAGSMAGLSGRNSLGLRAEWLSRTWESGLDLLAQCILTPTFDSDELAREKRRLLEELEVRRDSPSLVAFRLFSETLYRKHPYRLDVAGSAEVIHALDRKKLARYYRRYYPVRGMTLAIVGDVEPERALRAVRARFAGVAQASDKPPVQRKVARERFSGRSAQSREVYRFLDRNQAHLLIGFPGTTFDHPDRFALEVLAIVLGGQGGRLFVQLRDRQALAYHINASSNEGMDPGYFAVYLACSPDKLPQAVTGVRAQLQAVIDTLVTPEELERAKRYLIGTHEIALQRRSAVAAALAFHEAYGLGIDEVARYADAIRSVTRADVQRVAAGYLDWDLAVTATVKPPDASPAAARRMRGVEKRAPRGSAKKKQKQQKRPTAKRKKTTKAGKRTGGR